MICTESGSLLCSHLNQANMKWLFRATLNSVSHVMHYLALVTSSEAPVAQCMLFLLRRFIFVFLTILAFTIARSEIMLFEACNSLIFLFTHGDWFYLIFVWVVFFDVAQDCFRCSAFTAFYFSALHIMQGFPLVRSHLNFNFRGCLVLPHEHLNSLMSLCGCHYNWQYDIQWIFSTDKSLFAGE